MGSAADRIDGEQDRPEKTPFSWNGYLTILGSSIFIFLVVTFIIIFLYQAPTEDKLIHTIRWGIITGLAILVILLMQAAIDLFFENKKISFSKQFLIRANQFGIKKPKNGMIIARDTLLILFCALVPMDFLTYLIPGILPYIANSSVGIFFNGFTIEAFITIGVVYNLITGIQEEFVFRGYFLQRYKETGKPSSAWLCSALLFASLHVSLAAIPTFPAGPILWFSTALVAGLLFGGYVLATKRMLPVVLAHGIGDFISSTSIWTYYSTNGFAGGMMYSFLFIFYGPMLVAGLVLAIAYRRTIKRAGKTLKRFIRNLRHRTTPREWLLMIVVTVVLWLLSLVGVWY